MLDRRRFFQRTTLATALFGLPLAQAEKAFGQERPELPPRELLQTNPERYWSELRRQWLLAPDHVNLNCGSVGCSPLPVLRAMIDHLLASEAFRDSGYPWSGNEENSHLRGLRDQLATFLHCSRDELALVRNATEGNNVVCNGLDMNAGDEVVLTDQEHPGGRCCWEQKAARFGIKLRFVKLPRPPGSVDEIVDLFEKAITPRTRVLAFSHVTSPTGLILPAKEICQLARQRGVLTHIDGAHVIGQMPLDLHDLGCDFYATSPHKWLLAPKGTGTLFVREEHLKKLWVNTASVDWRNYERKAYRFSNVGTSNLSVMVGFKAALDFYQTLGPDNVYRRIRELANVVRTAIQTHPQLKLANASADPFFAGLVSFEAIEGDLKQVVDALTARRIRFAGGAKTLRIATHVFTQRQELQAFADALAKGGRG